MHHLTMISPLHPTHWWCISTGPHTTVTNIISREHTPAVTQQSQHPPLGYQVWNIDSLICLSGYLLSLRITVLHWLSWRGSHVHKYCNSILYEQNLFVNNQIYIYGLYAIWGASLYKVEHFPLKIKIKMLKGKINPCSLFIASKVSETARQFFLL